MMIQLFGCTARDRGYLTYCHLSRDDDAFTVERLDDKNLLVTIREGERSSEVRASSTLLAEIASVVTRYRMDRYSGRYDRKRAPEGTGWSFSLKYSRGDEVGASGCMKYPKDGREAFDELSELVKARAATAQMAKLEYFHYAKFNGMELSSGENYDVSMDNNGLVHIDIDVELPGCRHIITDYRKIFEDIDKLILENGMRSFNGSYESEFEVSDGDGWSLNATYYGAESISASGYMAWPEGFKDAIGALRHYFDFWRRMPAKRGRVSAEEVERFLSGSCD